MLRKLNTIRTAQIALTMLSGYLSAPAMAAGYAYVVVSASAKNQADNPYWVVLSGRERDTYLPVNNIVHKMLAGRYYIEHLGFSKIKEAASADRRLPELDIHFKLEKDTIYFLGEIVLSSDRTSSRQYDVSISMDTSMLKKACASDAELFANLPLKINQSVHPDQEYQLDCETMRVSSYVRENRTQQK